MRTLTIFAAMLTLTWFTLSAFTNFVVTPITLQASSVPGHYATSIYPLLNKFELFFAIMISASLYLSKEIPWRRLLLTTSIIPLIIAFYYTLFLTPSLSSIGELVTTAKLATEQLGEDYLAVKSQHSFYHQQYILFDAIKLLALGLLSCFMLASFSTALTEETES